MRQNIQKFNQLPREEKKLFLEAYITLGFMRMALMLYPLKRLTHTLSQELHQDPERLDTLQQHYANTIGHAVCKASGLTPWKSACLVQALTAQRMLHKRQIAGVFYLGVHKSKEAGTRMNAHAWTQCGTEIITGKLGYQKFIVISTFGWK